MKNSVTQEQVDNFIESVSYCKLGEKTCAGTARLKNGFEITETSACVDAANYDEDLGASLVFTKIKDKVWFLLGFWLQCDLIGMNPLKCEPNPKEQEDA